MTLHTNLPHKENICITNLYFCCDHEFSFHFSVHFASTHAILVTKRCEFHNETLCQEGEGVCNGTQECNNDENKRHHCYVLWQNNSKGLPYVKLKGCFLNNMECYDQPRCVEKREGPEKDMFFCCCEGDMCNREFTWEPTPAPPPTQRAPTTAANQEFKYILMILLMMMVVAVCTAISYWFYRRHKLAYFNEVPTMEPRPQAQEAPSQGLLPIQLLEVKARGRFGAVWKAQYRTETVAVKVFHIQEKQSWISEQLIYQLPDIEHSNILQYITVEQHGDNLQAEFWLITAFHEKGSLCDWLKANIVSWPDLCRIAETMARGLMHLHEEMPPRKGSGYKPAIAHRDFKSKNVLLKSDLTACIADFGLALIFEPGKSCGDTHGQVGTRRYMAPEVLEGAINFSRDAFLRIDMYACGLVLWELASRCTGQEGPIGEYRLPFEEEVGQRPTLEDMQECVVHKKQRPICPETWKKHQGLNALCDTMEECWDHDAEARLSASCVMERVLNQQRLLSQPVSQLIPPLLNIGSPDIPPGCPKDASL
ncbi:hypothetical protein ONE63_003912 [Megalurothrips usitatus]|uniref:Serine/threonine-protein kinase receptor n=1 Tax=Megalurothrips usitatus TaxID=439358 RepID=A0AAV7XB35_9NEOP|nr:hypothetical protein ONE63_003912 [Megalurothrips usitatus]